MRCIQGENRAQATMFPALLDDYVSEDNPVRFIDYFVDSELDMTELGFTHSEPKETGRKPYNPSDNLKLYLYGYLNRIRSSRRLEAETHKNIELMWLIRVLRPDHKTIADFRRVNKKAIKSVCREFTLFCHKIGLFGLEFFAIDGSKFAAVNHNRRAYGKERLAELVKKIDSRIEEYLQTLEQSDEEESDIEKPTTAEIQQKIKEMKERRNLYESYQQQLESSGETQIAVTDSDSRLMRTGHQGYDVCYNVQIVVDGKYKLIAEFEATNDINDQRQLSNMVHKVKTAFDLNEFSAAADAGYFEKDEIKECVDDNVICYVPEPGKSQNAGKGKFTNRDFRYDPEKDCYGCPTGHKLTQNSSYTRHGRKEFIYKTHACRTCPLKHKCTTSKQGRRIYRWEHEHIIEQMQQKLKKNRQYMDARRNMAEHPFGVIKHAFGFAYFLCKGLDMVNTEMSLTVLAYNLRRALNIMGVKELPAALK